MMDQVLAMLNAEQTICHQPIASLTQRAARPYNVLEVAQKGTYAKMA
jgi:hypothetical protein